MSLYRTSNIFFLQKKTLFSFQSFPQKACFLGNKLVSKPEEIQFKKFFSTSKYSQDELTKIQKKYEFEFNLEQEHYNIPEYIFDKMNKKLHTVPNNPLNIIRTRIEDHFKENKKEGDQDFKSYSKLLPIVSTDQNFDHLLIPSTHPSRSINDTYYFNSKRCLRTHTSAHQTQLIEKIRVLKGDNGVSLENNQFLISGDVYRKDSIDATHYPIFHQMEGLKAFHRSNIKYPISGEVQSNYTYNFKPEEQFESFEENEKDFKRREGEFKQQMTKGEVMLMERELKRELEGLIKHLFQRETVPEDYIPKKGESTENKLRVRWINEFFPFTGPSWELEVYFNNQWLEVLGCGVVHTKLFTNSLKDEGESIIGWAFGLGLERLAMIMFDIPDIRLFWSEDQRFLSQFKDGEINKFQQFSKYPSCLKDVTFWINENFHENSFFELVRSLAGDIVEKVELVDSFKHPKTGKQSHCYRIHYRSMDRNLTNEEINKVQEMVREGLVSKMGLDLR